MFFFFFCFRISVSNFYFFFFFFFVDLFLLFIGTKNIKDLREGLLSYFIMIRLLFCSVCRYFFHKGYDLQLRSFPLIPSHDLIIFISIVVSFNQSSRFSPSQNSISCYFRPLFFSINTKKKTPNESHECWSQNTKSDKKGLGLVQRWNKKNNIRLNHSRVYQYNGTVYWGTHKRCLVFKCGLELLEKSNMRSREYTNMIDHTLPQLLI